MNMIDVMKRLAELDAVNPNIVKEGAVKELSADLKSMSDEEFKAAHKMTKAEARAGLKSKTDESKSLAECGMGMPVMGGPTTPANISITAGSGEELSTMLKDIMSLAGIHKVEPEHLGIEVEPMALTAEPVMGQDGTDGEIMRGVLDKLNPEMGDDNGFGDEEGEEETDEEYDNTPSDPRKVPKFGANDFANQENQPGQGDRFDGKNPRAHPDMNETTAQLFADYQSFINESK